MSETVLVGIITATSALTGVLIMAVFGERRQRSDERRWYADYFLGKKVDALVELYRSLADWQQALNFHANVPPSTYEIFTERVVAKESEYLRALAMASPYLTESEAGVFTTALGAFRQVARAIFFSLPADEAGVSSGSAIDPEMRNVDWSRFEEAHNGAIKQVRLMLNPDALSTLEKVLAAQKDRDGQPPN